MVVTKKFERPILRFCVAARYQFLSRVAIVLIEQYAGVFMLEL
jgi:hypothetical protein